MKRIALAVAVALAACDGGSTPAAPPVVKTDSVPPAPKEPVVPAYRSPWSGFKVGASAEYTIAFVTGDRTDRAINRYILKELKEDKVVVTHESEMGGTLGKSSMDTKLSLKHEPTPQAGQTTGSESITVKAGTFDCTWIEFKIQNTTTRAWSSPKVPGGMVKSVSTSKGDSESVTTTELVKFSDGP